MHDDEMKLSLQQIFDRFDTVTVMDVNGCKWPICIIVWNNAHRHFLFTIFYLA